MSNFSKIKKIYTIKENIKKQNPLLILSDGKIALSSCLRRILIINAKSYQIEITLEGHHTHISYLSQLENEKLLSCSYDKSIQILTLNHTTHCEFKIIKAHDKQIYKNIPPSNERMASYSKDETIKIWNSNNPYNLLTTLNGHSYSVISIIEIREKRNIIIFFYRQ